MVVFANPSSSRSNLRLAFVSGSWRSLRSSFRKREIDDSEAKKDDLSSEVIPTTPKEVRFDSENLVSIIPGDTRPISDRDMHACWYQVSMT